MPDQTKLHSLKRRTQKTLAHRLHNYQFVDGRVTSSGRNAYNLWQDDDAKGAHWEGEAIPGHQIIVRDERSYLICHGK